MAVALYPSRLGLMATSLSPCTPKDSFTDVDDASVSTKNGLQPKDIRPEDLSERDVEIGSRISSELDTCAQTALVESTIPTDNSLTISTLVEISSACIRSRSPKPVSLSPNSRTIPPPLSAPSSSSISEAAYTTSVKGPHIILNPFGLKSASSSASFSPANDLARPSSVHALATAARLPNEDDPKPSRTQPASSAGALEAKTHASIASTLTARSGNSKVEPPLSSTTVSRLSSSATTTIAADVPSTHHDRTSTACHLTGSSLRSQSATYTSSTNSPTLAAASIRSRGTPFTLTGPGPSSTYGAKPRSDSSNTSCLIPYESYNQRKSTSDTPRSSLPSTSRLYTPTTEAAKPSSYKLALSNPIQPSTGSNTSSTATSIRLTSAPSAMVSKPANVKTGPVPSTYGTNPRASQSKTSLDGAMLYASGVAKGWKKGRQSCPAQVTQRNIETGEVGATSAEAKLGVKADRKNMGLRLNAEMKDSDAIANIPPTPPTPAFIPAENQPIDSLSRIGLELFSPNPTVTAAIRATERSLSLKPTGKAREIIARIKARDTAEKEAEERKVRYANTCGLDGSTNAVGVGVESAVLGGVAEMLKKGITDGGDSCGVCVDTVGTGEGLVVTDSEGTNKLLSVISIDVGVSAAVSGTGSTTAGSGDIGTKFSVGGIGFLRPTSIGSAPWMGMGGVCGHTYSYSRRACGTGRRL